MFSVSAPLLKFGNAPLPRMVPARQKFPLPEIADPAGCLRQRLAALGLPEDMKQKRVAVAVGSRGIADLFLLVRELVHFLLSKGASPFIVPAMGSHGGATAEGQAEILASYGLTAQALGVPLVSSMHLTVIGHARGLPVYCDAAAWDADAIVPVNRIKPHTQFRAPNESGLLKMLAIGLGKDKGAALIHGHGIPGLVDLIPAFAELFLHSGKILFGVGVVENARHRAARIEVLLPASMAAEEARLLREARELLPRLPVPCLDLLILDRIGKDISGPGMDSSVTGRIMANGIPDPQSPRIGLLAALDLTEDSHGNAVGVGLADFISQRLANKIDLRATYINAIVGGFPVQGKLPMVMPSDRELLNAAAVLTGATPLHQAEIIHADSTLNLEKILISEALLQRDMDGIEITGQAAPPQFDENNNLIPIEKL
jgi:hypothetical protein